MNTDQSVISEIKNLQISGCASKSKISLVITGFQDDAQAKATFFNVQCTTVDPSGSESTSENRFRYSQLYDLNEKLIHEYGNIRLLRNFPPKKVVGKNIDFLQQRKEGLQQWMTELILDEEICEEPLVREFFGLTPAPESQ